VNPGGILILIAGVWITTQVFGGKALERLKVITDSGSGSGSGSITPSVPAPADPNDEKSSPFGFYDPYGLGL